MAFKDLAMTSTSLSEQPKRRFHPMDRALALELYNTGLSTVAVAARLGWSQATIYYTLKRIGALRPSSNGRRKPLNTAEILRLVADGKSYNWVARRFGVSHNTIRRRVLAAGGTPSVFGPVRKSHAEQA